MKRTISRRGKGSKTASKKGSKKTLPPTKKRPIRRPTVTKPTHKKSVSTRKTTHGKPLSAATIRRQQRQQAVAREQLRLIREQEAAARRAEREARRAERQEQAEIERLIEEQEEAERQARREEKAERRRDRATQLREKGYTEKKVKSLVKLEEYFEREAEKERQRAQRRAEKEETVAKKARLREWRERADAARKKRGMSKKARAAARKQDRAAAKEVAEPSFERYITESLWEVYNCLGNLGYKVDEPQCWKYQDGSFDAQIRVNDPDDTTGQDALLELQKCVRPVAGAYIALGFRHYPSLQTERRIEMAELGGKPIPGSLYHKEMGQYTNLTNYRLAGQSEIAAHMDVTHKWLGDFAKANQAFCSQILVRYYYSPESGPPPGDEHDRINEGENPGGEC
jgi:hypothetical protein